MSVNAGTFSVGGGRALKNLGELADLVDKYKIDLRVTIRKAGNEASKIIKEEVILPRGAAGKYVSVDSKRYGPFGLKISISADKNAAAGSGSTSWSDPFWAAQIFLKSENGEIGRQAFTLSKEDKRYKISRSSGRWQQGEILMAPLNIPQIGAYYFSKGNQPIRKEAYEIMLDTLNDYHYNFIVNPRGRGGI